MPSIKVNDTQLFYLRYAQPGKPVMLLSHSLFFDHSMFEPLIRQMAGVFDLLVYDHRGQGASAPQGPLDMDTLTQDALALMDALELPACHVAGNSMGGFVALRLAARYPQRILSCTVMGSSAAAEQQLKDFEPLVQDLAENGPSAHIDTLMHIMFGDNCRTNPACQPMLAHWRAYMQALPARIAQAAQGVIYRQSVLEELSGMRTPLMVLAGAQDHAYPVALSEQIVSTCGQGELHVIPGVGHSVALEAPDKVATYLCNFTLSHR